MIHSKKTFQQGPWSPHAHSDKAHLTMFTVHLKTWCHHTQLHWAVVTLATAPPHSTLTPQRTSKQRNGLLCFHVLRPRTVSAPGRCNREGWWECKKTPLQNNSRQARRYQQNLADVISKSPEGSLINQGESERVPKINNILIFQEKETVRFNPKKNSRPSY